MNLHSSHCCRSTGTVPGKQALGRAFTLIETIGVLSVVAILVSLLTPTIMDTVDRARVTEVIASYNQVRAGAVAYAAKYGYLGGPDGQPVDVTTATNVAANWDAAVLLPLEYIERPFRARVSTTAAVELRQSVAVTTQPNGTNPAYNLEGAAGNPNTTSNVKHVLDVKLEGMVLEDARYLNRALDGEAGPLGETTAGTDLRGRVKYQFSPGSSYGEVRIYITHL